MSKFFIFAGPNGSGKSTIIEKFLFPGKNNSANTTTIRSSLSGEINYINADYLARVDPDIANMPDSPDKALKARERTDRLVEKMLSSGITIAWETVFSHESRLEVMEKAKRTGYEIHLIYVTTKDPDINITRVHTRFTQGGHNVPEDKIRERYKRSVSFLPEMILKADEVSVYDNSGKNPQLLFQKLPKSKHDKKPEMGIYQMKDKEVNEWAMKFVAEPLEKMGFPVHNIK